MVQTVGLSKPANLEAPSVPFIKYLINYNSIYFNNIK